MAQDFDKNVIGLQYYARYMSGRTRKIVIATLALLTQMIISPIACYLFSNNQSEATSRFDISYISYHAFPHEMRHYHV